MREKVNLRTQSEYRKIRTRNNSVFGQFSRSESFPEFVVDTSIQYNLLNKRHQKVVLNGQSSKWPLFQGGVPQGSISGSLLCHVYINGLPQGLHRNVKIFADNTNLFSTITSPVKSSSNFNEDLLKITYWWKNLWKLWNVPLCRNKSGPFSLLNVAAY